ncbi:hypothetical protein [Actinospica robiniae]|uniref:hypothetical protein n=1 Tax=Actinospica robiniae TaxID=304901 RepID=UPI0003FB0230|nr:hypothetical protein [Actinospica robiniae]
MHDTTQEPDSGDHLVRQPQADSGCGRTMIRVQVPPTAHREALVPDGGSPGVSHSVWLPPASGPSAPAFSETTLPAWTLARIGAQFLTQGVRLGVCHGPGPARTGLEPAPTAYAPDWFAWFERFGPDEAPPSVDVALVLADAIEHEPPIERGTVSKFWRALRQSVGPGGLVLAHTRQIHNLDGMHDPCGHLVTQAHAGLSYIQHHVLVHTRLLREPLSAADPAERHPPRCAGTEPAHRQVHSDLLAFLA